VVIARQALAIVAAFGTKAIPAPVHSWDRSPAPQRPWLTMIIETIVGPHNHREMFIDPSATMSNTDGSARIKYP
jgi:hypothetical protein